MYQSVRDAFTAFSVPLEGCLNFMYLDVKSLVTTGLGNLIDTDDPAHPFTREGLQAFAYNLGWFDKDTNAASSNADIDAEYATVKHSGTAHSATPAREAITHLRISDGAVDQMVSDRLDSNEATLAGTYPNLGTWPADAQLGLFSMAWAMGAGFNFPNFANAANSGQWKDAATQSHIDEANNPGLRPRNVRDGLLFTIAGWTASNPGADPSALVYDPNLDFSDSNPYANLAANMRSGNFPIPLTLDIGVQTALEKLSSVLGNATYDPQGIDGTFGPHTRTALNAFETDQQIAQSNNPSGVAGVNGSTLDAIAAVFDANGVAYLR